MSPDKQLESRLCQLQRPNIFVQRCKLWNYLGEGEGLSFNFLRGTSVLTNRSNRSEGNRSIGYQQFDTGAGRRQRGWRGGVGREGVGGGEGV